MSIELNHFYKDGPFRIYLFDKEEVQKEIEALPFNMYVSVEKNSVFLNSNKEHRFSYAVISRGVLVFLNNNELMCLKEKNVNEIKDPKGKTLWINEFDADGNKRIRQ